MAGIEEEFFLVDEGEGEGKELGGGLVEEGKEFFEEVSGKGDSVRGEGAGKAGDEVGDGWLVPL